MLQLRAGLVTRGRGHAGHLEQLQNGVVHSDE